MKKIFFTVAMLTIFGFAANAQTAQEPSKKPTGVRSPKGNTNSAPVAAPENAETPAEKKTGPTRMAITEKGAPATKAKPVKEAKAPVAERANSQPAPTEKR